MTDWSEHKANIEKETQKTLPNPVNWPPILSYPSFAKAPCQKPKPLIANLLDCGSRILFGGGSKTYKTWLQCDLAICLACGCPWLGFSTVSTRVLYVNFELKDYYIQRRLASICEAKEIDCLLENLTIWNLRGFDFDRADLCPYLLERCKDDGIQMVFIDPFYKLLRQNEEENKQTDMGAVLRCFDPYNKAEITTAFGIHFSKGNQAGKEPEDRISGAGTLVRDPDNIVTLTKHEQPQAFILDFIIRDHPPIDSFVVQWNTPIMVRTDLDPAKIKKPALGRRESCDPLDLLLIIKTHDDELKTNELVELVDSQLGWSKRTVMKKLNVLESDHQIFKSKLSDCWNIKT
jgi:hypothetical protein